MLFSRFTVLLFLCVAIGCVLGNPTAKRSRKHRGNKKQKHHEETDHPPPDISKMNLMPAALRGIEHTGIQGLNEGHSLAELIARRRAADDAAKKQAASQDEKRDGKKQAQADGKAETPVQATADAKAEAHTKAEPNKSKPDDKDKPLHPTTPPGEEITVPKVNRACTVHLAQWNDNR